MVLTGKMIRLIRINHDVSVIELAKLAQITPGYLGRLETETWPMTEQAHFKIETAFALLGVTAREMAAAQELVEAGRDE